MSAASCLLPPPLTTSGCFTDSFMDGVVDRPNVAGLPRGPNILGALGALKASCGRKMNKPVFWLDGAWERLWGKREIFLAEKLLAIFSASELADQRQCPQHQYSPGLLGWKQLTSQSLGFAVGENGGHYGCKPWRLADRMRKVSVSQAPDTDIWWEPPPEFLIKSSVQT